eukprot:3161641-Pleurochrysis_carterae.AAC.1
MHAQGSGSRDDDSPVSRLLLVHGRLDGHVGAAMLLVDSDTAAKSFTWPPRVCMHASRSICPPDMRPVYTICCSAAGMAVNGRTLHFDQSSSTSDVFIGIGRGAAVQLFHVHTAFGASSHGETGAHAD